VLGVGEFGRFFSAPRLASEEGKAGARDLKGQLKRRKRFPPHNIICNMLLLVLYLVLVMRRVGGDET